MYDHSKWLFPKPTVATNKSQAALIFGYQDLRFLPDNRRGYFYLHAMWPSKDAHAPDLPVGYDYYVVSCHMEHVDFEWLQRQTVAPIFFLCDFTAYCSYGLENVQFMRWMVWHKAIQKMRDWFGDEYNKKITHKASVFCNRITQSKAVITTALLETMQSHDVLVSLSDWLEEKNVHFWQTTGNATVDSLMHTFRNRYLGHKMSIDDFDNSLNFQQHTANPHQAAYQQAALHFTNESFHYSLMNDQILPGPHLTEKTFKCLLGGTAFIPVGQYDVYATLVSLGMQFDYGLDLSFDQDPGNLTRLEKIVVLIRKLEHYSAQDLFEMTKHSSRHNQEVILSAAFDRVCDHINQTTLSAIESWVA